MIKHQKVSKCYENVYRFNCVFSRDNLPRVKYGVHAINLSDKQSKGIHLVSLFLDRNMIAHLNYFGIENLTQHIAQRIKDKSIT